MISITLVLFGLRHESDFKFQVSSFKDGRRNHFLESLFAERQRIAFFNHFFEAPFSITFVKHFLNHFFR